MESQRTQQERLQAEIKERHEQLQTEREAKEAAQLREQKAQEEEQARRWEQIQARAEAKELARKAEEEERAREREAYIKAHASLGEEDKDAIRRGRVVLGMDTYSVWKCVGLPDRTNKSVSARGTREQWAYSNRYLYFENGILTSWQERY